MSTAQDSRGTYSSHFLLEMWETATWECGTEFHVGKPCSVIKSKGSQCLYKHVQSTWSNSFWPSGFSSCWFSEGEVVKYVGDFVCVHDYTSDNAPQMIFCCCRNALLCVPELAAQALVQFRWNGQWPLRHQSSTASRSAGVVVVCARMTTPFPICMVFLNTI